MDPDISALQQELGDRNSLRNKTIESRAEEGPLPGVSEQNPHPYPTLALAPDSVLQTAPSETEAAIIAAREHNASIPVNNLPPELFTRILQMALKDAISPQRFLENSLLVCRPWNQVVLDSPTLWTRWDVWHNSGHPDPLQSLRRILIQSKSLGLTLSAKVGNKCLWGELGGCMSRWQDVSFDLGYNGGKLFSVLPKLGNDTAPKLRRLFLRSHDSCGPLDIFDPHDPSPSEKLELYRTAVVWNTMNFERLRYLDVSGKCERPPSVPELLQILGRTRRLKHLCLKDMKLSPGSTGLSTPSDPVCLPHLSYCKIACSYTADTLIHMIRFPSCKEVFVSEALISGPGSLSSLAHVAHVIENTIKVTDTTFYLEKDKFRGSSSLLATEGEPEAVLRWFINMARAALNASPAVKLLLESNFSYDQTMRIITELSDLKNITELHFLGYRVSANRCDPLDCIDNLGDKIQQWVKLAPPV
ncbi:hypothetical protein FRC01_001264 [Tulasnella sp. 417]|nr:hypothetical protein FRC01_001264 [Tulasnella sp. 417]